MSLEGRGRLSVDAHAHLAIPEADGLLPGAPFRDPRPELISPERRLVDMDAMRVDIQVVSPVTVHSGPVGSRLAARFSRATNEAVAAHCAASPSRLVGLGTALPQHPRQAVDALDHAVLALGLRGVSVPTKAAGRELADPRHDPLWARAEELGAVVFVHPGSCPIGVRRASRSLGDTIEQPIESTSALAGIIFGGVLDRFPNLKLLAAHGGGYLPAYIGRADHAWEVRPEARTCARRPSDYLRQIWFDALVYSPEGLESLVSVTGPGQVVLGTDYPLDMGVTDPLDRLELTLLGESLRERIRSGNARRLLATRTPVARAV